MKHIAFVLLLSVLVAGVSCSNSSGQQAKTQATTTYHSQEELVRAFLSSLMQKDTANMMKYLLTEDLITDAATTLYIETKDTTMGTLEQSVERAKKELNHKIIPAYHKSLRNLMELMEKDGVDLKSCTERIDTVRTRLFKSSTSIIQSGVNIDITDAKNQSHFNLKMYALLKFKGNWYILGPKWEWQDHSVPDR